jgi:WD40 repeat protein
VPGSAIEGRRLGDFLVREKLGEGGMGVVHRAEQPALAREAVVKLLREGGAAPEVRQRFLREARLASRLEHPLAAHVYAFGAEDDGTLWIAMELVRGRTLAELIAAGGPLPRERLVPLLEQICDVVASAHEKGIVHRDLKPSNIMVLERGGRLTPKLLDFGLAKLVADVDPAYLAAASDPAAGEADTQAAPAAATRRGARIGTPRYMAPEQWTPGADVDARADQYALGVVAWECLAGRPPFSGDIIEVGRAHMQRPLPPLGGDLPPALDAVLARACAKAREDRFPSLHDFAAALRAAAGLPAAPEPPPPLDDVLRAAIARSPQPLAEALAAVEAAGNLHQARDELRGAAAVVLRLLVVLALASRTRAGPPDGGDPGDVHDALRALHRRELTPEEALALVEALVRPFAARPETHPLPELVALLGGARDWQDVLTMRGRAGDSSAGESLRDEVAQLASGVSRLVAATRFLAERPLCVARGGEAEPWMGTRRPRRAVRLAAAVPEGEVVLADADGAPVLRLHPLVQALPPSPGAAPELFVFAGRGRGGSARLVAPPAGFERHDDGIWDWFRDRFGLGAEDAAAEETAPYRGLLPFGRDDAARFLGRERQTEAALNRLRVSPLLVVAGPSGAGKSSFVLAGLLPSLADGRAVVLRPGAAPLATLVARLAEGPSVLVVDQLEELFTLAPAEERAPFAAALVAAAREPVRVIATLRDDFLARAVELPAFRERLAPALELLATPPPADLVRILVEPARRAGYAFDDRGLPERMVEEVAGRPAALALLSFTAARLWELRDRHFKLLTRRAYQALGGVGGALAGHAEEALAAMTSAERATCREAFRHLVTADGTRAGLSRAELDQLLGPGGRPVIERLLSERLLGAADDGRVEIVHEALIAAWPRLATWRREDAEGARLRDQLRSAARQWDERRRPRGLLWRGDALDELRVWRARTAPSLTGIEEQFAAASLRDAARGRRTRRALVAGAFATLLAALAVVASLRQQAHGRLLASLEDQARQHMLAGDSLRGLAFVEEALRQGGDGVGLRYLAARGLDDREAERAVLRHGGFVHVVELAPDGARVATGSADGKLAVWDLESGARLLGIDAHAERLSAAAWRPDGQVLATAGFDGAARLWDAGSGRLLATLRHDDRVYALAWSPDGGKLATAGRDRAARVWDAATGAPLHHLDHGAVARTVAFDARGERLLVGGSGTVRSWDLAGGGATAAGDGADEVIAARYLDADRFVYAAGRAARVHDATSGALLATLGHPLPVLGLAVAGDGARVVTASADGTARVWEPRGGQLVDVLVGHAGGVGVVRFCRGDSRVVTGGTDGTVRLWELATAQARARFHGHLEQIFAVDCGARVVSGGLDETARIWDPARTQLLATLASVSGGVHAADVSADGRLLVANGRDGRVTLWDVERREARGALPVGEPVSIVLFTADGRQLISADRERATARLWDVAGLAPVRTFAGHGGSVSDAEASRDGRRLVTASLDGTARLWDLQTGAPRATLAGHQGPVYVASFSPDGSRVVTASADRTARTWSAETGAPLGTLAGHTSFVLTAFFDRAGRRVVTASTDRTARVWDAATGAQLLVLEGHRDALSSAIFAGDDRLVVSAGRDGAVILWDAATGARLQTLRHAGSVGNVVALPGGRLVSAGEDDGELHLWDVSIDARPVDAILADLACRAPLRVAPGGIARRDTVCSP